jgi:hypothetical protein
LLDFFRPTSAGGNDFKIFERQEEGMFRSYIAIAFVLLMLSAGISMSNAQISCPMSNCGPVMAPEP